MKMKKVLSYFLYVLIILILAVYLSRVYSNRNDEFIKSTAQYLPAEKLNKIILTTRTKIEENPEDIFSYIENGIANYQKGKEFYSEAINQLQKAQKLGAVDIRVPFYLGIMYDELSLTDKAFSCYEKFLRNRSKDVYIRMRYGNLYFRLNRYDSASEQYEIAAALEPKNQIAIINLALTYKARDMYDESIEKFKLASSLKAPLSPEILMKIAELYFVKKDFTNAGIYYKKVLEKKPDSAAALLELGETYLGLNQKEEAKKCFQKVILVDAGNIKAKKYLSK
ncbi:MAG: tetratricopeptide repeat protein [Elusimicrobia bacterium]|nr:tetratricopeptide repeat protein [Elusimicrobiota bacterium]